MKTLAELLQQHSISNGDIRYMTDAIKDEVRSLTPNCNGSIREKLFWLQHDLIDYPKCLTCEKSLSSKNFQTNIKGGKYNLHCSVKCAKRDPHLLEKYRLENDSKYDVDYFVNVIFERQKTDQFIRGQIQLNIDNGSTASTIAMCQSRRNVECRNIELAMNPNRDTLDNLKLEWHHHSCGKKYSSPIVNGNIKICPHCNDGSSVLELSLRSMVASLINETILFNSSCILTNNQVLQIYIPSRKIAFEIIGTYWHSTSMHNRISRIQKLEECNNRGITLIFIREQDLIYKSEIVESYIKRFLNLTVNAQSTTDIRIVDSLTAKQFTCENNIDGFAGGRIHIGMFSDDEMISLLSVGLRRFKRNGFEIYRYTMKKNLSVEGKALLDYFFLKFNPSEVVAFQDKGMDLDVFSKMGMIEVGITKPSYVWVSIRTSEFLSRFRTQKKKLAPLLSSFDASLSEAENMCRAGWLKVWNCGSRKFIRN